MFKKIYYKISSILPAKLLLNIEHYRGYRKKLNLKEPKYFGEKIQWLKLYGGLERYSKYVDKYEVRDYVSKEIGEVYLNELLGVYNDVEDINFNELPDKFVLKGTHGCGYNLICKDKKEMNINKTREKLRKWLNEDFSKIKKEPQYSNIKPRLVCERFLDEGKEDLTDYKVYCFNGKPSFIQVVNNRSATISQDFYDIRWKRLDMNKGTFPSSKRNMPRPICLDELLVISEKLTKDFPFVRADFYIVKDRIIFGELTFTPAGGLSPFSPISKDLEIGRKIDLSSFKQ